MATNREPRQTTSASPSSRTDFTREMIYAALKEAEPAVADLSKKLKESASRHETTSSLRLG